MIIGGYLGLSPSNSILRWITTFQCKKPLTNQKYSRNPAIITNYFIFIPTMPPSRGDNFILESGTGKTVKVAMRDLAFWLPHTKPHLCDSVKFAHSFQTFVKILIYYYNHRLKLYMYIFDQVVLL